jgi:methylenetetrahydrofolate reductase (NADPH)
MRETRKFSGNNLGLRKRTEAPFIPTVRTVTRYDQTMTIAEAYGPNRFGLSFELFPPKTAEALASLHHHVDELVKFQPSFITCTYGAGGSTQDRTLEVIAAVRQRHNLPVATHLTCVGRTPDQLLDYLRRAEELGIENVVALRGDPPKGETSFKPVEGGFRYGNELVAFIRREMPQMGIAVGGYPEKHLEAPSFDVDLANLKRKVDAGADAIITQLFYRNEDFFRFRDRCTALGVTVPIVPGMMPVTNFAQIQRIASLSGATLPKDFEAALERHKDDPDGQFQAGVEFAAAQAAELMAAGIPGIHFYVLNKSEATKAVLTALRR